MEKTKEAVPRSLPIILYEGQQYFTDLRLNEFRPVRGLFSSIPFDSEQGKVMCRSTGVVTCISCGMSVIISKVYENNQLRCMQCFSREFLPLCDG